MNSLELILELVVAVVFGSVLDWLT